MLGTQLKAGPFLKRVADELLRIDPAEVQALADMMFETYRAGRFVFVIGNGGSGSNASHFCEDIGKGTLKLPEDFDNDAKKRLKILSLTDNTPYILAWGNDEGFDRVFVEQLKNLASPGDLLIAISGSGNSPNILTCRRMGEPERPKDVRLHGVHRRQTSRPRAEEPARAARRYGHRRIDPPHRVPLGRGRPAPADFDVVPLSP